MMPLSQIHNIINVPIPPLWKDEEENATEFVGSNSASVGFGTIPPSSLSPVSADAGGMHGGPASSSAAKSTKHKGKTVSLVSELVF